MSLQGFIDRIVKRLREDIGENYQIEKNKTMENNGVPKYGVKLWKRGQDELEITFYLCADYTRFQSEEGFEVCIRALKRRIEETIGHAESNELRAIVSDWNRIKQYIFPIVVNTEKNEELLKKVIHRPFLDMTVLFRAILGRVEEGWVYIDMNEDLLTMWNITRQELEEQSCVNLEKAGGQIYSCGELEEGAFDGKVEEIKPGTALQKNHMYILTNERKMFGAAQILNRQLLREIAGGCNLYILPCCIHELILLVDDGNIESEELSKVMQNVEITIMEEDLLQAHSYYYDFVRDEILNCS